MRTYKLFDRRYETYLLETTGDEFVTNTLDDAEDHRWYYLQGKNCPEFTISIHEFTNGILTGEVNCIILN